MTSRVLVALRVAASPEHAFDVFTGEIGRVTAWEPGRRLGFEWRQASFAPEQTTQVEVRFDSVGAETRVTVEHAGWDRVPAAHVARHGFPDGVFLQRHGEWWQRLLGRLASRVERPPG